MIEVIKKEWEYTLYELDDQLILSVLCGSVAIYTVSIALDTVEKKEFLEFGEKFIDDLAKNIRETPNKFESRQIDLSNLS